MDVFFIILKLTFYADFIKTNMKYFNIVVCKLKIVMRLIENIEA